MTRPDPLGLESTKQHPISPGPVADAEIVCRGGFDPMHYRKGKPKPSIVKNSELVSGVLSVWRAGTGNIADYLLAVTKLGNGPEGNVLKDVFSPPAAEIRDIAISGHDRVFYVVDDCRTDENNGADPLHAGVRISPALNVSSPEDDIYIRAKAQLILVLTSHRRSASAA